MELEIWKDIPEYKGIYQVSNLGNIKSLNYRGLNKESILKQSVCHSGYEFVVLYNKTKRKTRSVHQLVCEAFLNHKPCGHKLVVNHINHIKTDNRLCNLEIITQRENASKKNIQTTSEFVGVYYYKKHKKWSSSIWVGKKIVYLGFFDNELEASQYYKNALISLNNGSEINIKRPITSSKYKGVSYCKERKKWRCAVYENKKLKTIGRFNTEEEAYQAKLNYNDKK